VQKNELLQELQGKIKSLKHGTPTTQKESILELDSLIRKHISIDRDWEDFKRVFEEVHTDFHKKLMENHPELSANDLKICALTRLNLNIKETAGILNISPESVKTARYRLRKKLGLDPEEELLPYLLKQESSSLTRNTG
jgi:DNA-binding CsgD family transcriptional regulator